MHYFFDNTCQWLKKERITTAEVWRREQINECKAEKVSKMHFAKESIHICRYSEGVFLSSAEIMDADFSNQEEILKQIKGKHMSDTTTRADNTGKNIHLQLNKDLVSVLL